MPAKTYSGGCHCGKVRFDVTADIDQVVGCNCSICMKHGSLLAAVKPNQFTLRSGQDNLADYQFHKHVIHHLFCRTCGTKSFARGTSAKGEDMVVINVRCLDNVDLSAFKVIPFDGKSL